MPCPASNLGLHTHHETNLVQHRSQNYVESTARLHSQADLGSRDDQQWKRVLRTGVAKVVGGCEGGGAVRPPRAAEFMGRQHRCLNLKKYIFCAQQILNYYAKYK